MREEQESHALEILQEQITSVANGSPKIWIAEVEQAIEVIILH